MATSSPTSGSRWLWWRRFRYMVQLDDDENDEEYLQMIEYKHINLPSLYFPFAVFVLVIVGLVYDEISDGTVNLYFDYQAYGIKSVAYQCGWEKFAAQYEQTNGLKSTEDIYYRKSSCHTEIDASIKNFCSDMEYVGKVWLACGIMGIIWAVLAFAVAFKLGKERKSLGVLMCLCWVNLSIGVGTWNNDERCKDIESWTSEIATFDTHTGVSMVLLYTAIAHAVLGFVLWCYFMVIVYIRSRSAQPANQPESLPEPRITIGKEVING